ncbi:MAG: citryl-CoA lyase [Deltaproteobacteria bacterium]|nr:MAG: citryl-CoA lyase [Deltaproteobacteria bacterium]
MSKVTTSLCESTATDVRIRGRSLPGEIIGSWTFTEMVYFHLTGREATAGQRAVLDACLVTLMEHGLTPTAISTRLTYTSAPEAMQGAVAAGLLSVGSLFVGTMEGCGQLLARIVAAEDAAAEAADIVAHARAHKQRLPGFGHPQHTPVDPRTEALLDVARAHDLYGAHCEALDVLDGAIRMAIDRPLPPNATAAIAALLADADVPIEIARGIALISRCAGLVGHIREEQQRPAMRELWHAAEQAVPYVPEESE